MLTPIKPTSATRPRTYMPPSALIISGRGLVGKAEVMGVKDRASKRMTACPVPDRTFW